MWEDEEPAVTRSCRGESGRVKFFGGSSVSLLIVAGLVAFGAGGVGGSTTCYLTIADRQGSSMMFAASPGLSSNAPLQVCIDGINVCQGATNLGNMSGSALHSPVYPSAGAAHCGLFCQEVTAEAVVRIDDDRVFQSGAAPVTLMGNMMRGTAGAASGWRIACFQSRCCFQAHIGHKWSIGSSNIPLQRLLPPMREVCTRDMSVSKGVWYHVAASYSAATATAKIYLDGFLHAQAVFPPSGDLVTGTLSSTEINYDYIFKGSPWWAAATPDAACAPGASVATVCTKLGAFRIGAQLGVDHNGAGVPGTEVSFFNGMMDEVRVWRSVRDDQTVEDGSFEIVERDQAAGTSCALLRLASSDAASLTALVVHLHHPNMGTVNATARSVDNEVAAANGPDSLVALVGLGSVNVMVLGTQYIDRPVTTVLKQSTSKGILLNLAPAGVRPHTVVVGQHSLVIVDMQVYDPNYDDTVWIDQTFPLRWSYTVNLLPNDRCYINNGQPFSIACNDGDPVGWAAFSGFQADNYQGPGGSISRQRRIDVDPSIWCVDTPKPNAPAISGLVVFAPPYTTTRARVTYRVVWQPRFDLEWWVPEGGWGFLVGFKSTVKGAVSGTSGSDLSPLSGTLEFVVDVDTSPEFLDPVTYPKYLSKDAGLIDQQPSRLLEDTLDAPAPDAMYVTKVGTNMTFAVRARDRNVEDTIDLQVREVYGLPAGASQGRLILDSTVKRQSSTRGGVCFSNTSSRYLDPPMNFERRFTWTPALEDMGVVHKLCFYAVSSSPPNSTLPVSPDSAARTSMRDRCVILSVVAPKPSFVASPGEMLRPPESEIIARVGCKTQINVRVLDSSMSSAGGFVSSDPYQLLVRTESKGSRMCTAGGCIPLPGGLPDGATMTTISVTGNTSDYAFEWIPRRGQELHESYRLCLTASDPMMYVNETVCYRIKVRKCQYCLQPGETMRSVAQDFQLDFLELYLANPSITRPDHLAPYSVITTGALYDVRDGDYLELLQQRFLLTHEAILSANPDIRKEVRCQLHSLALLPASLPPKGGYTPECVSRLRLLILSLLPLAGELHHCRAFAALRRCPNLQDTLQVRKRL